MWVPGLHSLALVIRSGGRVEFRPANARKGAGQALNHQRGAWGLHGWAAGRCSVLDVRGDDTSRSCPMPACGSAYRLRDANESEEGTRSLPFGQLRPAFR